MNAKKDQRMDDNREMMDGGWMIIDAWMDGLFIYGWMNG